MFDDDGIWYRNFCSRVITAAASQGLAASQSSGGSASTARSESGAPLRRPWAADRRRRLGAMPAL